MSFKKGDRVVATEKAYKNGVFVRAHAPVYGTVACEPRDPERAVNVRKDGNKNGQSYHPSFWRVAAPHTEAP